MYVYIYMYIDVYRTWDVLFVLNSVEWTWRLDQNWSSNLQRQTQTIFHFCIYNYRLQLIHINPPGHSLEEFLDWLLQQRRGQVTVNNIADREDVTEAGVKIWSNSFPEKTGGIIFLICFHPSFPSKRTRKKVWKHSQMLIVFATLPGKWLASLGLWYVGFPFATDGRKRRKRLLPKLILQELQFLLLRVKYYTMHVIHIHNISHIFDSHCSQ